jgi:pimeloyl-ACP methyl ester carboxylesterase
MLAAFLIPGFSQDQAFNNPKLDLLKSNMAQHDILLNSIADGWNEDGIHRYGERAVEQHQYFKYDGILIGHSLGALAALSVIDQMPVRHLILCSPSALFAEDIPHNLDPLVNRRLGARRVQELTRFSALKAVSSVNELRIPTTILFGEKERELHPLLVARSRKLAAQIARATLIEVANAEHSIHEIGYASELARVVKTATI